MSMTREEQLELVARNFGEWKGNKHFPFVAIDGDVCFYITDSGPFSLRSNGIAYGFTREEVEAKRREITGEPDDKDAPEWANWKAQDDDGIWHWYGSSALSHDNEEWFTAGKCVFAGRGEVLGSWRDTLKKINREQKEASEVEEVEFKNGDKVLVEVNDTSYEADYIGRMTTNDKDHVCHNSMWGVQVFTGSDIKPLPSERDEFVSSVLYCFDDKFPDTATPDCTVALSEMIYDAIKDGKLKAPSQE